VNLVPVSTALCSHSLSWFMLILDRTHTDTGDGKAPFLGVGQGGFAEDQEEDFWAVPSAVDGSGGINSTLPDHGNLAPLDDTGSSTCARDRLDTDCNAFQFAHASAWVTWQCKEAKEAPWCAQHGCGVTRHALHSEASCTLPWMEHSLDGRFVCVNSCGSLCAPLVAQIQCGTAFWA